MESKLDDILNQVQSTLKTMLGLARNELEYPALFIIAPVPDEPRRSLNDWLTAPDKWLNKKMKIVFVCERSLQPIPYDESDGLEFLLPKEWAEKPIGAVSKFWRDFGPVIKLAAALIVAATKATTGAQLDQLAPVQLVSQSVSTAVKAVDFVQRYAECVGEVLDGVGTSLEAAGVEYATWDSVKPKDGIEGLPTADEGAQRVVGKSYREFAKFLETLGFDKTKLSGRIELVHDEPAWVAERPPSAAARSDVDVAIVKTKVCHLWTRCCAIT